MRCEQLGQHDVCEREPQVQAPPPSSPFHLPLLLCDGGCLRSFHSSCLFLDEVAQGTLDKYQP
jgi:hypothetical protein